MMENDLYISGESYAGIYVPYLALRVHQYNLEAEIREKPVIPMVGIMVGNGVTDFKYDADPVLPDVHLNF